MANGLRVVVRLNRLAQMSSTLRDQAATVTERSATDLQAAWQTNAPVRTGAYRRSITTQQTAPLTWAVFTPLVNPPYPDFLESGTRFMAPRPSAGPAAALVRPRYAAQMRAIGSAL